MGVSEDIDVLAKDEPLAFDAPQRDLSVLIAMRGKLFAELRAAYKVCHSSHRLETATKVTYECTCDRERIGELEILTQELTSATAHIERRLQWLKQR